VVHVGPVRVSVGERLVAVGVAVPRRRKRAPMRVCVMPVIVPVAVSVR
jgi:hypothetical protein